MCCAVDCCGGCRHSCRRFRTGAEGYGIFIGHFCIAAKSHAVLRRYRSVVPQHHSAISGNRGIAAHCIGIIRINSIFVPESACHISFHRAGSDCRDFILISTGGAAVCFRRSVNRGGADGISGADSIGLISVNSIFRSDGCRFFPRFRPVLHIQTHLVRIPDGGRPVTIGTYLRTEGKRIRAPAPCHDTDTGAGYTFGQRIDTNRRGSCAIGFTQCPDGRGGVTDGSGVRILPFHIDRS